MKLFFKRKRREKEVKTEVAVDALNLLMNDKINQMSSIDALISLLIQKRIFTKEEFDQIKRSIENTKQYQEIYQLTDKIAESLDPSSAYEKLTDKEIDDLMNCLLESEINRKENENK